MRIHDNDLILLKDKQWGQKQYIVGMWTRQAGKKSLGPDCEPFIGTITIRSFNKFPLSSRQQLARFTRKTNSQQLPANRFNFKFNL
jgi:hypothetical protein